MKNLFVIRMSEDGGGRSRLSRVGEEIFKLILCCEYRTFVDIGNMLINEMTDVD